MQKDRLLGMLPLFLVIAIDSMGLGILFPILSSMFIDVHSSFLAANTSSFMRELLYGVVIGIYMIAWFFGAAILGDISDTLGRKKSLLICLFGAAIGYGLSGLAFVFHSVAILIVGRVIAGFTAGSQPIAQAAVVDMSSEKHKARNIGLVLLAVSLGFVLGPLLGGFFSDTNLVSWFHFSTPMYVAAVLSLANMAVLALSFKETHINTERLRIRLHYAIQIFIEAFRHKKIRYLSLILLIFISGWGEYFGFISQFLLRAYHYTPLRVSLFMAVMAVGFSVGFAVIVDWCANRFDMRRTILVMLVLASLFSLLTIVLPYHLAAWVLTFFIGVTVATAYSLLITAFSNLVSESEQGWVMGVTNAIMALSFGVTTFFSGFAANMSPAAPIWWAFGGMLISGGLMLFARLT
ncbi:MAG: MFS transporter [Gammaproteobacteria bacterium CG11_big_fil_rev_8_21_14_0_20_46_22]|nr:MAG: MFS transporter [Gammaproteobacteria bacterium CG12_big_fil_rev_8_21_14_0_65_46_12]PIR11640.1 MAG: MFS transporter [Gammaproteobacteria bacterium CG11_big_fil_rev_8_21_14_0_20_46_22]